MCKTFVNGYSNEIKIDEHAILDYYVSEDRGFYPLATMKMLLKKGVKIEDIIKKFSITETKFNGLVENANVKFESGELDLISKVKTKTQFDAFTRKEAKSKNFLNA